MKASSPLIPNTLVGLDPSQVLLHGPSKLLADEYLWFSPKKGAIVAYTPKKSDVKDHFGIYRGVDQVESFGLSVVSAGIVLECMKLQISLEEIKRRFTTVFVSIGQVNFHGILQEGETFITIGKITFYKFRQISMDGRIYKTPKNMDLESYFKDYKDEQFDEYQLDEGFELIAEINGVTGRNIKKEKFKEKTNQ